MTNLIVMIRLYLQKSCCTVVSSEELLYSPPWFPVQALPVLVFPGACSVALLRWYTNDNGEYIVGSPNLYQSSQPFKPTNPALSRM